MTNQYPNQPSHPWNPQQQEQPWQAQLWQQQTQQQQPWQSHNQQPPLPSGPAKRGGHRQGQRHRVRNGIIIGAAALVVLIIIGVALGGNAPHNRHSGPPVSTSPVTAPKPLTPGEEFARDMNADPVVTVTGSTANLIGLGRSICKLLGHGGPSYLVADMMRSKTSKASAKEIIHLAEKDMCPNAVAQAPRVLAKFSGSGDTTTRPFVTESNWFLRYSYDCSTAGGSGNFIVSEGASAFNGVSVNELDASAHNKKSYVYNDAGEHHLQVISECSWSMAVVGSAP